MINKLEIYREDKEILVVRKPAGIPSQSGKGMDMVALIRGYLGKKSPGQMPYVGAVHRLDQPVMGVMVFAKTPKAAASLSKQFQSHTTCKEYYALVEKEPVPAQGRLCDYLIFDKKTNTSRVGGAEEKDAKKAELLYEVVERNAFSGFDGFAFREAKDAKLLHVTLLTGRHHQIRVQTSHGGFPIWGDNRYNPEFQQGRKGTIALCSAKLEFDHPTTGKRMTFSYEDPVTVG